MFRACSSCSRNAGRMITSFHPRHTAAGKPERYSHYFSGHRNVFRSFLYIFPSLFLCFISPLPSSLHVDLKRVRFPLIFSKGNCNFHLLMQSACGAHLALLSLAILITSGEVYSRCPITVSGLRFLEYCHPGFESLSKHSELCYTEREVTLQGTGFPYKYLTIYCFGINSES